MNSCIQNVLNDVLDFFVADHVVLFICKFQDIESARSYANLSTQLFNADTSVNLGEVNFSFLICHSRKDIRCNLNGKYFFSLAVGLSRVLCNRVNKLFRINQLQ